MIYGHMKIICNQPVNIRSVKETWITKCKIIHLTLYFFIVSIVTWEYPHARIDKSISWNEEHIDCKAQIDILLLVHAEIVQVPMRQGLYHPKEF